MKGKLALKKRKLPNNKYSLRHRWIRFVLCAASLCIGAAFVSVMTLRSRGLLFDDPPPLNEYPYRGAYVCEETGEINWELFNEKYITFCYIRATRGSTYIDSRFTENYRGALHANMPCGLVHDLDYSASASSQVNNLLSAERGLSRLPAAIDIRMNVLERLIHSDDQKNFSLIISVADELEARLGERVLLLMDKNIFDKYGENLSQYEMFAFSDNSDFFASDWTVASYSQGGKSQGLADDSASYTMLTLYKGIKLDDLTVD